MKTLAIIILIDLLMSFLVVVYTANYVRLREEHEEIYGEDEKPSEPECSESKIEDDPLVDRQIYEIEVYRDKNGVLHRDFPKYQVEVESNNQLKVIKTPTETVYIAYRKER